MKEEDFDLNDNQINAQQINIKNLEIKANKAIEDEINIEKNKNKN